MRKKGFTFIEIMIAISIFFMMVVFMKIDSNTQKQINNIRKQDRKVNIAQGQLERLKSNPDNQLQKLKSEEGYSIEKIIDGYHVLITNTGNAEVYDPVVEVEVTVQQQPIGSDEYPYSFKSHLLVK